MKKSLTTGLRRTQILLPFSPNGLVAGGVLFLAFGYRDDAVHGEGRKSTGQPSVNRNSISTPFPQRAGRTNVCAEMINITQNNNEQQK